MKRIAMAMALALAGVAGAQTIKGAWIKHQIMSCYRPAANDVVKCDVAITSAVDGMQIQSLGNLTLTAGDGREYRNTSAVVNGKTETLNTFGDFPDHRFDPKRPVMATYLFKVPATVSRVTVSANTGGDSNTISGVEITVPNTAAAITIYKSGVPSNATSFTLSGCKKVGNNQYSCSAVTGK